MNVVWIVLLVSSAYDVSYLLTTIYGSIVKLQLDYQTALAHIYGKFEEYNDYLVIFCYTEC